MQSTVRLAPASRHSLQWRRSLLCLQTLPPAHSLHEARIRLCSQTPVPWHSMQLRRSRLWWQMLEPPASQALRAAVRGVLFHGRAAAPHTCAIHLGNQSELWHAVWRVLKLFSQAFTRDRKAFITAFFTAAALAQVLAEGAPATLLTMAAAAPMLTEAAAAAVLAAARRPVVLTIVLALRVAAPRRALGHLSGRSEGEEVLFMKSPRTVRGTAAPVYGWRGAGSMSSLAQKRNALGRGQVPSNYVPGTAACRRCAVRRRGMPGCILPRCPLPP